MFLVRGLVKYLNFLSDIWILVYTFKGRTQWKCVIISNCWKYLLLVNAHLNNHILKNKLNAKNLEFVSK